MAKFITGKELEDAVYNIIWEANEVLLIVSPYIKLDSYFKKLFNNHLGKPNLHIIIVFGKNEGNAGKSFGKDDIEFFKQFPCISVVYVSNLHAKYYGNEQKGVITSINLYDYSFVHNIEFGVYSENKLINLIAQSSDKQAWEKCMDIANNGEPVFVKRPVFQKKLFSALTGAKNYLSSDILLDNTEWLYAPVKKKPASKLLNDYPEDLSSDSRGTERPTRDEVDRSEVLQEIKKSSQYNERSTTGSSGRYLNLDKQVTGYCIRTGVEIPFNPSKPFSAEAYKSWAQWENPDFREKFCHKTGRPSNGNTSMRNPILN